MVEPHSGYEGATIARGTVSHAPCPMCCPAILLQPGLCLPLRPATTSQLRNAAVMMSARATASMSVTSSLVTTAVAAAVVVGGDVELHVAVGRWSPPDLSAATAQLRATLVPVYSQLSLSFLLLMWGAAHWHCSTQGCWQMGESAVQRHTSFRNCFHTESLRPQRRSSVKCFLSYLLSLHIPLVTRLAVAVAVVAPGSLYSSLHCSGQCSRGCRVWSGATLATN